MPKTEAISISKKGLRYREREDRTGRRWRVILEVWDVGQMMMEMKKLNRLMEEDGKRGERKFDELIERMDGIGITMNEMRKEFQEITNEFGKLIQGSKKNKQEIIEIKEELINIKESNNADFEDQRQLLDSIREENQNICNDLNKVDQYIRRQNIIISGIPLKPEENCEEIVGIVCKEMDIKLSNEDIQVTHRLAGRGNGIIVRFSNQKKRNKIWEKRKMRIPIDKLGYEKQDKAMNTASNGPLDNTGNQSPTVSVTNSEAWEKNKKFTVYKVIVEVKGQTWFVFRRYNEFSKLLDILKRQHPNISLKLPGKKLFGNNFSSDFIKSRRQALNDFIQKIVAEPTLLQHQDVKEFLNIDKNINSSLTDEEPSITKPQDISEASSVEIKWEEKEKSEDKLLDLGPTEKKHVKPSDFDFLKVIGKGSFGKVLLAKHKTEENIFAVKVLQKKMILKRNEKSHVMSERNVLLKNLHHPFLVGLKYSFQTPDKLYFVLDYVNGGELFFHLQRERYFQESRARFYAAEITSALGYLHSEGIIYRDLKPENILLDYQGHVVLTDFGLSKEGLAGKDTTSTFCGTPEYLAPEVLKKQAYDKSVDWWCLGAVLYEMLYGLPPFYSKDTLEMYQNILNKPLRLRTNISLAARSLLEGLLQKEKSKRLGSISDVEDIKKHEFFRQINWIDLEAKNIPPPFNPNVRGQMDLKNIDPEFIREPVPASLGKSQGMSASVQDADSSFQGFSYAPPIEF